MLLGAFFKWWLLVVLFLDCIIDFLMELFSCFFSCIVGGSIRFYDFWVGVDDLYGCFWSFPWYF